MKLEYSNRAQKDLKKLPISKTRVILKKIELLQTSPFLGKKLGGKFSGCHSFRVWPYRVIYQINKVHRVVTITTVEHRQGAYK